MEEVGICSWSKPYKSNQCFFLGGGVSDSMFCLIFIVCSRCKYNWKPSKSCSSELFCIHPLIFNPCVENVVSIQKNNRIPFQSVWRELQNRREKHENECSRKNDWKRILVISLENRKSENPCIMNYMHGDEFLRVLKSSVGTNVLNISVWSMDLSETNFQCIILNRPPSQVCAEKRTKKRSDGMTAHSASPLDCRTHQ